MRRHVPSAAQVRGWKITQPVTDTGSITGNESDAVDPMHGYTLANLDDISRHALHLNRWHTASGARDRYDAAWHAIVEHILTAEQAPTRRELIGVAIRASDMHVRSEMHHHGLSSDDFGQPMPAFGRYWGSAPTPSPEARVVERQALEQIWPSLTAGQQKALSVLAATEDYDRAAEACGIAVGTLRVQVSSGRRRFLALWHEGETPSRQWRTDRRVHARSGVDVRGFRRLTESELEEIRSRYSGGQTLTSLAAEAGIHKSTLSALLSGRTRPAPDPVGA